MKSSSACVAVIALIILIVPLCAIARQIGSDDGKCGDPTTNETCNKNACHTTYPVNSGNGLLTLNNVPTWYDAGATYNIEVMLSDEGMKRWGFQVTALDGSNLMAGGFTVTDAVNTWLSNNPGTAPDYMNHTLSGTYGGTLDGPVYWDFDWTAPASPVGTVRIYLAGCAGDSNVSRSGDYIYTYTQDVMQANHDVTVVSLDNPPDSICVDTTYIVQASVTNNGGLAETFDLIATIAPSGYTDTVQVILSVGQTRQVTFQVWQCPAAPDTYTYTVNAALTADVNPGDNTLNTQINSYSCAIHDAGVVSILAPPDSICVGSTYNPRARVTNMGNVHENLSVSCEISPGGYIDTALVVNIAPAETSSAVFTGWTVPGGPNTYSVVVRTLAAGDTATANDSLGKQSVSYDCTVRDVGIVSLLEPPLEACLDSTYAPALEVMNYGNGPESFRVGIQISPGYLDTFLVSNLLPGQTTIAVFTDWIPNSTPQTYQLSAGFSILDDVDPSNDSIFEDITVDTCFWRDLGVVSILSPDWWVCTDSTYTPSLRVINNGEVAETFIAGMTIGPFAWPVYRDSVAVVGLTPGNTADVDLKDWTAPWLPDTFTVSASVILGFVDKDPANDIKHATTYIYNCPGIAESGHRFVSPGYTDFFSAFPSPARNHVVLDYVLKESCDFSVCILDASGRQMRLFALQGAPAGYGRVIWDLRTESGAEATTGVYFVRFSAAEYVSLKKFLVIR